MTSNLDHLPRPFLMEFWGDVNDALARLGQAEALFGEIRRARSVTSSTTSAATRIKTEREGGRAIEMTRLEPGEIHAIADTSAALRAIELQFAEAWADCQFYATRPDSSAYGALLAAGQANALEHALRRGFGPDGERAIVRVKTGYTRTRPTVQTEPRPAQEPDKPST
jgi:hypothetical protein